MIRKSCISRVSYTRATVCHRIASPSWRQKLHTAAYYRVQGSLKRSGDARVSDLGPLLEDEYASLRSSYKAPKHPIVLAHGLFGFDTLHLAGARLPGLQYWRGIIEALQKQGVEVFTITVPPFASIEERAAALAESIERKVGGRSVSVVAGLDSRYMISRLKPPNVRVISLTTIATPHRGSEVADYIYTTIPAQHITRLNSLLTRLRIPHGAFEQLTTTHMTRTFNPSTPNDPATAYYSYGASLPYPRLFSPFRRTHRIILEWSPSSSSSSTTSSTSSSSLEKPDNAGHDDGNANDGLVSVRSAQWGTYKGTLLHVSHLDLINWTNRFGWWIRGLVWGWESKRGRRGFNAVAFYVGVCDMLAREGH